MEITDLVDTSSTHSFQILDLPRKKKKKKKSKSEAFNEEKCQKSADTLLHSPFPSDCTSFASWQVESQESEDRKTARKKSKKKKKKKKASEKSPDPPCDSSSIVVESELNSEAGVDCVHKKKKKRKHRSNQQDGDSMLCVSETPEEAISLPETTDLEGADCGYKSPSLKKKKKRKCRMSEQDGDSQVCLSEILEEAISLPETTVLEGADCGYKSPSLKKKKKRKRRMSEQDGDSQVCLSEILEEAISLPETTDLEGADCGYKSPSLKKKKKRKRRMSEQDGDSQVCLSEILEKNISLQETTDLEGADCGYESPPLKKKKKTKSKEVLASEISDLNTNNKTTSTESPNLNQPDHSDAEIDHDRPSEGEGVNGMAKSDRPDELSGIFSQKKVRKHEKSRIKSSHTSSCCSTEDSLLVEETEKATADNGNIRDRWSPELFASEEDHGLQEILSPTSMDPEEASSHDDSASETSSLLDEDLMEGFSVPALDYEAARKELEEFIPHIRSLTDSAVRQLASRDLDRFKKFKEKGITVKFGKFTKKEDRLLRENIEAFLNETEIDRAEKLFFPHRFPEDKIAINKLKAKHHFCLKMAEGIPRPWRLVYYRGRRLYDPQNHQGLYSEEDKKKLRKYQAMYGNSWTKISELMGRSSRSVEHKFSDIRYDPKYGRWSSMETRKLIEAVSEVLRARAENSSSTQDVKNRDQTLVLDRKMLYKGIPWFQIETKVGTRHWKQCRKKWHAFVVKKITGEQKKPSQSENTHFRIKLIRRLYKVDAEEESEINWEDISSTMGNLPPNYLQNRYYRLKTACVPFWNKKSFPEIVYYLYKEQLPQLKAQVESRPAVERRKATTKDSQGKEVFPFNFFFHLPAEGEVDC